LILISKEVVCQRLNSRTASYVDTNGDVHEHDLVNPVDADISAPPDNPSPITANYQFPADAAKLTKIEIEKCDDGAFTADNISLTTTASVTVGLNPVIRGLSADSGAYGDSVTITGGNFGATPGFVSIGGSSDGVNITNWSYASITATINEPARSGRVYVVADYVESNIDFSFNVTSPHFTVDIMDDDVTVVKGQETEFVVAVDFKNGFTPTDGITFSMTELSGASPVFTPASLTTEGGTLLKIDTSGVAAGIYTPLVNAFKDGSATPYCSVPFLLEVVTVSNINFYEWDESYTTKTYITEKAVTSQGRVTINYEAIDSNGDVVTYEIPVILASKSDSLAVYPNSWSGYDVYAIDSGSATLTATAPDDFQRTLSVNINIPDTPRVESISITPSSITNKSTPGVVFTATGTGSLGAGISGSIAFETGGDTKWSNDNMTVTRTFTVDHDHTELGTYFFSAFTGTLSTHTAERVVPFTITNDSSYSAISGAVKIVDPALPPYAVEHFTLEFYDAESGILSFSRDLSSYHGGGEFTAGAIQPGTYKVCFVVDGNVKAQWWPNAADPADAQPLTFTEGGSVDNIFFFAEFGSTISGSVAMNNWNSGAILIGAFTDQALTHLARGTELSSGPGAFTIEGLEKGTYYVAAVLDANDNGEPDDGELSAVAGVFPVVVGEKSETNAGIINLGDDGGALNGTVQLGTDVTAEGTVYVGAFSDADMTQIVGGAILDGPGNFTIQNLSPGDYYVGSYMDVGGNNSFPSEPGEEDPMGDASGNPVAVTIGTTADAGAITLTESSQTDISFTCAVVFSDNSSAVGATVEMVGNPSLSTTTANNGTFTLASLPVDTPFSVKISKEGYADTYSAMMGSDADINSAERPFALFTSNQLSDWGVTTGKGVIKSRVRSKGDGTPIGGAAVSCVSALGNNYTIVYVNETGELDPSATSTSSKGKYFILNVEEGDQVYVTAEKAGWAFDGRVFMTHADSVSESPVFGTQDADKLAIHTRLQAAIDEYNAKNLSGFMAYISANYLDDGMNKQDFSDEVSQEMGDPDFQQISYMILNTTVDDEGLTATTYVIWSYGEIETLHFIKEGGIWLLSGNQKKYEVDAWSQNWNFGQQYMVHFQVDDPGQAATSVTITGPGINGSLILDYDINEGNWNSWHTNDSLDFGSAPPTPPLEYEFTVVYGDPAETFTDTCTVQSFVNVYATNLSPSGTAADPLVFSWTGVGAGYTYQVQLSDTNRDRIWDSDWNLTTTSVSYDEDPLTPGAQYLYQVVVEDMYGNSSFVDGSFTYVALGNVNGDTSVNLTDAILALKVIAGMDPEGIRSDYATSGVDVNGDGKIGMAEVIYILQHVAGLR